MISKDRTCGNKDFIVAIILLSSAVVSLERGQCPGLKFNVDAINVRHLLSVIKIVFNEIQQRKQYYLTPLSI